MYLHAYVRKFTIGHNTVLFSEEVNIMYIAKLIFALFIASMLVGCPPDTAPVEPVEEEIVEPIVEPVAETCNEGACVKEKMPACLGIAGARINQHTVLDWLLICEKPPVALSEIVDGMEGKTTGCFVCVDEQNRGYLTWRHQFHVSHGVENCQN